MVDQALGLLGHGVDPWGYLVVFLAAALESSAFVGLVVPGETVLLLAGVLAARGSLALWPAMVVGVAGVVLGDSVGYEIGRHLGPRLEHTWAGRRVGAARWERARRQVRRRGPHAVLVGRFVGVLRAVVPAVAGDARMPYRSFLAWNVAGAAVWTPLTVGVGFLAGESYAAVARYLGWASLGIVAGLLALALVVRSVRRRRVGAPAGRHGLPTARS